MFEFEKVKASVKAWAIDRVVAAVLGSAVVTAIIDAIIRYWVATPIQWRIPLVLSVFLLAYAGFWKFSEAKGWGKATFEPRWQFEPKALLTEMRYLLSRVRTP